MSEEEARATATGGITRYRKNGYAVMTMQMSKALP
jgi:hypothetical protein